MRRRSARTAGDRRAGGEGVRSDDHARVDGRERSRRERVAARAGRWTSVCTGFWGIDPEDTSAITLLDTYITPYPGGPADERYTSRRERSGAEHAGRTAPRRSAASGVAAARRCGSGATERTSSGSPAGAPVVADHVVLCLPFTTLRDVDLTGAGFDAKRMRRSTSWGWGRTRRCSCSSRTGSRRSAGTASFTWTCRSRDSWDSALAEPGAGGLLTIFSRREDGRGLPGRRAARAGAGGRRRRCADVPRHVPPRHARLVQRALVAGLVGRRSVGEGLLRRVPARAMDAASSATWALPRATSTSPASTRRRTARGTSTAASRRGCARLAR